MSIDFLKLHPIIEKAQDLEESPLAKLRYTSQIQLLPFNPLPYKQITAEKVLSLTIGSAYKVYLVRARDKFQVDVTDHVNLTQVQINGRYQIKILISYLLQDFGKEPVYFKVDRYGNSLKYYYSNRILVTNEDKELTSRLDYYNPYNIDITEPEERIERLESINLQFYFNNDVSATEIGVYYQITTGQNVNTRALNKEYKEWETQIFNSWTFKRLARAFYGGKCYINQVRNYPIEGLEYKPREGHTNISEMNFITDPNDSDIYGINEVIINPDGLEIPFLSSTSILSSTDILASRETILT